MNADMTGRVHSIQSMGALDGPGIRYVVFMQGCHLRCGCCHNPDTWAMDGGQEYTAAELVKRAVRFREYFGDEGGVTVSGGEPLLQPGFVSEFFRLSHENGMNTCLDTSGSIMNPAVEAVLSHTDRVLLDVKYVTGEKYRAHVGCAIEPVLNFLARLDELRIPATVRQVTIPGLNDDAESVLKLRDIVREYACVDKIELLPFKKLCQLKYDKLGIEFPFAHIPEPTADKMAELEALL